MKELAISVLLVVCCHHMVMSDTHFGETDKLKEGEDKIRSERSFTSIDECHNGRGDFPPGCCQLGFTQIDLTNNAAFNVINGAPGIVVISSPTAQGVSTDCSKMALLKVNFNRFTPAPPSCLNYPVCGRYLLRIDLKLSPGTRSGYLFNIGDSNTNNGYGGDGSTQENDSEVDGFSSIIRVFGSDKCGTTHFASYSNATGSAVSSVTIYIGPQYFRVVNNLGFDESVCDDCMFALSGQSDNQGSINEDVYVALNRVVSYTYRNGIGVCSATLSWVCPWYNY